MVQDTNYNDEICGSDADGCSLPTFTHTKGVQR
jgi:hypothetical protein